MKQEALDAVLQWLDKLGIEVSPQRRMLLAEEEIDIVALFHCDETNLRSLRFSLGAIKKIMHNQRPPSPANVNGLEVGVQQEVGVHAEEEPEGPPPYEAHEVDLQATPPLPPQQQQQQQQQQRLLQVQQLQQQAPVWPHQQQPILPAWVTVNSWSQPITVNSWSQPSSPSSSSEYNGEYKEDYNLPEKYRLNPLLGASKETKEIFHIYGQPNDLGFSICGYCMRFENVERDNKHQLTAVLCTSCVYRLSNLEAFQCTGLAKGCLGRLFINQLGQASPYCLACHKHHKFDNGYKYNAPKYARKYRCAN